ncbi:hypothetical protein F5879DRAFT_922940 [Lentinula edodes]|nr:hypothetical protein F5879DRAFT_922940 [Lentinula edodes]
MSVVQRESRVELWGRAADVSPECAHVRRRKCVRSSVKVVLGRRFQWAIRIRKYERFFGFSKADMEDFFKDFNGQAVDSHNSEPGLPKPGQVVMLPSTNIVFIVNTLLVFSFVVTLERMDVRQHGLTQNRRRQ